MSNIEYIRAYSESISDRDFTNTLQALINCLSVQESCALFDTTFQINEFSKQLIRKIQDDIEVHFQPEHDALFRILIENLTNNQFKKSDSCAYVLENFFPMLPAEYQEEVLAAFLFSKFKKVRDRAYKQLIKNWNTNFTQTIINNWRKYKEFYCKKLILSCFPPEVLIQIYNSNPDDFELTETAHLFQIIVPHKPGLITLLKEKDEITYMYVLVKLGKRTSVSEANNIVKNNYLDQRIGLLVWCLGKMNLRESIEYFIENFNDKIYFDDFGTLHLINDF